MKGKKISMAIGLLIVAISLVAIAVGSSDEVKANDGIKVDERIGTDSTSVRSSAVKGFFEDLTDFGFDPKEQTLTSTISIKQTFGFNNFEFVTFWIDWNNDGVFVSNEVVGISNVFVPNPGIGALLPIRYATSVKVDRPPTVFAGSIRRARATLTFATPTLTFNPGDPTQNIQRNIRLDSP